MKKHCLTCKYEPVWSDPIGPEGKKYKAGFCKYMLPNLPACMPQQVAMARHFIDTGIVDFCLEGNLPDLKCLIWSKKK